MPTTFDDREKAQEAKYAFDAEAAFKIAARRNRLLGLWVAEQSGLSGDAAEEYARNGFAVALVGADEAGVVARAVADLAAKGKALAEEEVAAKATELLEQVKAAFKSGT